VSVLELGHVVRASRRDIVMIMAMWTVTDQVP